MIWFKKKQKRLIFISKETGLTKPLLKEIAELIRDEDLMFILIEGDPRQTVKEVFYDI